MIPMNKQQFIDFINNMKSGGELLVADLFNYGYNFRQNESNEDCVDVMYISEVYGSKVTKLDFWLNIDYNDRYCEDDEIPMVINRQTKQILEPQFIGFGWCRTIPKSVLVSAVSESE